MSIQTMPFHAGNAGMTEQRDGDGERQNKENSLSCLHMSLVSASARQDISSASLGFFSRKTLGMFSFETGEER